MDKSNNACAYGCGLNEFCRNPRPDGRGYFLPALRAYQNGQLPALRACRNGQIEQRLRLRLRVKRGAVGQAAGLPPCVPALLAGKVEF